MGTKKIETIKIAMKLLKQKAKWRQKIGQWKRAAKLVAENSHGVNKEFQAHSMMKSD